MAVVHETGEIVVCDSSNHRVQVFTKRGQFVRTFGKYGCGKGEFDCLAGCATNRYGQLIVTDRLDIKINKPINTTFQLQSPRASV